MFQHIGIRLVHLIQDAFRDSNVSFILLFQEILCEFNLIHMGRVSFIYMMAQSEFWLANSIIIIYRKHYIWSSSRRLQILLHGGWFNQHVVGAFVPSFAMCWFNQHFRSLIQSPNDVASVEIYSLKKFFVSSFGMLLQ